jgi:protein SCO1
MRCGGGSAAGRSEAMNREGNMEGQLMNRVLVLAIILICASSWAEQQYSASGMVVKVDAPHKSVVISCQSIPGYMEAMTMPFDVRQSKELDGIKPGMTVEFTLVVEKESSHVEKIRIRGYESVEQDPLTAQRLKLLNRITDPKTAEVKPLSSGQRVPDFTLIDQKKRRVRFSQFAGKVVAINFIYTSCALPNYCFRISNNFGVLQKRFKEQLGRDLVLLTVTFDPVRDQPEVLAHYASTWNADPETWHFLTGPVAQVQRVTSLFGVDYFPDEGLMNHSLHTVIIDRQGRLITNIEGNQFSVDQLSDLVESVLYRRSGGDHSSKIRLARN